MVSKLSGAVSTFIRTVFNREQLLRQELSIGNKGIAPVNRFALSQLPGIDASLFGDMGEAFGLDRRRLYRYSDYEQMDEYPDITGILDIYADDSTQTDSTTRKNVWIECQNEQIRDDLDNVFHKRLRIGESIWEIARQLCKMGNEFDEIVIGDMGVIGLNYLPTATMHRIEAPGGITKGFIQSYSTDIQIDYQTIGDFHFKEGGAKEPNQNAIAYEDWRVVHWRLRSKNRDSVYGWGVTEPARWVWKRLKLLEDAVMIYKLTRSPSRYQFSIDVTGLSTQQAERKLQEAKQRLKKRKFINPQTGKPDFRYSPLSMDEDFFVAVRDGKEQTRIDTLNGPAYQQVEDVEYFLHKLYGCMKIPRAYMGDDSNMPSKATLCIAGDTKIPLLDGTAPTIAELSKRKDSFWVYSVDRSNNFVPGLAKNARLTRKQAKTVEVELDNGEVLTCTPDHPIMMRDGSYEEAGQLKPGDSVMPFYTRRSSGRGRRQQLKDYEQVYHPGDGRWIYTHRMVTDALFEEIQPTEVRHHINFDRNDNRPENLQCMDKQEHLVYHRKHAEKTLLRLDVKAKRKVAQAEWLKTDEAKKSIEKAAKASKEPGSKFWDWVHSDRHKELKSEQMKEQWKDSNGKMRKVRATRAWRQKMSDITRKRIANGSLPVRRGKDNNKWRHDAEIGHLVSIAEQYRCRSKKELIKWSGYSECLMNRVFSEYGISYRDFAEQFMVPSKMRDAAYRRGKNHKVIAVRPGPVIDTYDLTVDGYHNFAVQAGVVIHNSSEDVRFAMTILRIQNELRNGLHKIGRVHLASRNIDPASVEFKIAMTVPSAIFELGQMEVRRARADLAALMERHVSLYWLLSNVYALSDDEITQIMKQKEEETKKAQAMGGGGFESISLRGQPLIDERELFAGNKEHEKKVEDIVKKAMESQDSRMGLRLRQTEYFIRELLHALQNRKVA